jgi:hypothetical protein
MAELSPDERSELERLRLQTRGTRTGRGLRWTGATVQSPDAAATVINAVVRFTRRRSVIQIVVAVLGVLAIPDLFVRAGRSSRAAAN